MKERAMRPFWIHQLAEYMIGIALVSQGLQDTEPLLPSLAGTGYRTARQVIKNRSKS
jgi:hypothetical protein